MTSLKQRGKEIYMKGIILAAGRGSRMQFLTRDRPKCLVELAGQSLLARQVEALKEGGVTEIGIVRGYRAEMFDSFPFHKFENKRWAETNMVESLVCAKLWLQTEPCIVSYSDIFYEASAVELLVQSTESLAITYDPRWYDLWSRRFDDPLGDAESFLMNAEGYLTDIGGKLKSPDEAQGQYMGLLRFTPEVWQYIEQVLEDMPATSRNRLDMTSLLRQLLTGAVKIKAIAFNGCWGEVDSESDLALYAANMNLDEVTCE